MLATLLHRSVRRNDALSSIIRTAIFHTLVTLVALSTFSLLQTPANAQQEIYSNDFESTTNPLTEWSIKDLSNSSITTATAIAPFGRPSFPNPIPGLRFLGTPRSTGMDGLGPGTATLNLTGVPPHGSITVKFDLYLIGSWDGNGTVAVASYGPDIWQLTVGSQLAINTTFSNIDSSISGVTSASQDYPVLLRDSGTIASAPFQDATAINSLGYKSIDQFADTTYHIELTADHLSTQSGSLQLAFKSLQEYGNSNLSTNYNFWEDETWGLDNVQVIANPIVPDITTISPDNAYVGTPNTTITINGKNFVSGSNVRFGTTSLINLSTTYVSPTQLTAIVPYTQMGSLKTANVSVKVPTSVGGAVSNDKTFTVNPISPTITSVSQDSANAGSGNIALTIDGTNFVSATVVRFGIINLATTFVSPTKLTANIPASQLATGKVVNLFAVHPVSAGSNTSNVIPFTIYNLVPTITSVSPSSATARSGNTTITVTGTNFVSTSTLQFNSTNRTITSRTATQLVATIPSSQLAAAGTATITVTNPAPGGGSNSATFTVNP